MPLLHSCFIGDVSSGTMIEPRLRMHMIGPPAPTALMKRETCPESRAMLWKASEAAIGEKWEL